MGDEQPRTVALPLSFMASGRWRVRALVDGSRPQAVAGHEGLVRAGTTLRVPMAARGGAVLVLDRD